MFNQTDHQKNQLKVIDDIEKSLLNNQDSFSVVEPVADFLNDNRMALTAVHFPKKDFLEKIREEVIEPLKQVSPNHFYYPDEFIHMTVKNVKTINDPPIFSEKDIEIAKQVFEEVIPKHKSFKVYYYRLFLFKHNFALMGTTDPGLDNIILELDKKLKEAGVPDDKVYLNSKYFFSNVTLARFNEPVSKEFKEKLVEISENMKPFSYEIDSTTLLTCNAVMNKRTDVKTWKLGS
jgi:hypothetical protein